MSIPKPRITVGGTAPDVLMLELVEAIEAVRDAERSVGATMPNGRDYPPDVLTLALDGHNARLRRLADIRRDLESLLHEIDRQASERGL